MYQEVDSGRKGQYGTTFSLHGTQSPDAPKAGALASVASDRGTDEGSDPPHPAN